MTSDDSQHSRTRLLRELEFLRAQLADPETPDYEQDEIPLLIDQVEKAIGDTDESAAEASTDANTEEIAALRAAYQQASEEIDGDRATPVEEAMARLAPDQAAGDANASPAQQALFEPDAQRLHTPPHLNAPSSTPTPVQPPRPVARGDNPFLPKHIRDRLEERRQALADDIAQASTFFPPKGAQPKNTASEHSTARALVDDLVAEYLPRIEADLRRRLLEQLNNNTDPG